MPFRPLVLCYHAISDRWTDPLSVRPTAFEEQLRLLLRAGLRPVDAGEVAANRRRTFHITFDDAYENVASAVPVMERVGARATVFACSGYAARGGVLDVPELRNRRGDHPEELKTLSWDGLRELAARGVEIGSHTISHAHLPELSDEELARELTESRESIEDELQRPCRFLAYPFGERDARVEAAARAAGYLAGYALRGDRSRVDAYALPRVDVYRGDGTYRFILKVSPLYGAVTAGLDAARRVADRATARSHDGDTVSE